MKIYISGPMAGIEGYEKNFKVAEVKMKESGHEVVNPAEIDVEGMDREEILDMDLKLLRECDGICMLKGWQQSCGANREYGFALAERMGVMFEEDER
ncbi:DUF4406 domain-containing protein [Oscillospiraceae bacterium Marseille-Q3528]|nr:DUF4406 domain-containing protein [Oscillospiraceae bacterium Marseille-Q3528]